MSSKIWLQYTYRVRIDELGPTSGGEGPRAYGVGEGKPLPLDLSALTRPTMGRRTFDMPFSNMFGIFGVRSVNLFDFNIFGSEV